MTHGSTHDSLFTAWNVVRLPLRKHFKSRFPGMNVRRLHEKFSTDVLYGPCKDVLGRTHAQIFYGSISGYTHAEPLNDFKGFGVTLLDFIRKVGAMDELRNDNASNQISEKVQEILRWFYIKQTTSEPHHQHQNAVEGRIGDLLVLINRVLDRRNAPEQFWYLALQWVIDVDNIIATKRGGQVASPIQRAFGVTPDC